MGWNGFSRRLFVRRSSKGRCTARKVNFVRYADDFIITGTSKESLENEVKPLVEKFMLERGLQLSPEKTCITHIEQGFDFLGQNLRKYNGKLLITPSKKNMHAFLEKVRDAIHQNRTAKQENLIGVLNPMIRVWANYHRHIVASSAYQKVGMGLWNSLWRWAKRRHPKKSATWIADRYWSPVGISILP
jgi:RNA-directed DNA polymerase